MKRLDENLNSMKISKQDYIDHENRRKNKKGRYGVTVPQPFEFDARDRFKHKTIRE